MSEIPALCKRATTLKILDHCKNTNFCNLFIRRVPEIANSFINTFSMEECYIFQKYLLNGSELHISEIPAQWKRATHFRNTCSMEECYIFQKNLLNGSELHISEIPAQWKRATHFRNTCSMEAGCTFQKYLLNGSGLHISEIPAQWQGGVYVGRGRGIQLD
jgi:hypothetical protein